MSILLVFGLLAALLSPVTAQTWTACNPLNRTDCPKDTALSTSYTCNFTNKLSGVVWNTTAGALKYGADGAEFTIAQRLDSPTIQSKFYIFFGILEIHMKAAAGKGIVSSIVLQSDDLDEIDWEWVGGDTTHVQTNYFGKGNTTTYDRGKYHEVDGPMDGFHNYTVHWTADKLDWYVDGNLTRTLLYGDAVGGKNYPQTPMTVRLGIWPGGDPKNSKGTVEWAGGPVDYGAAPYTMIVKQMKATDFSSGKEYQYSDKSGSWQSIKAIK
jgi:beta-glucanase (GH16 family)